MPRVRSVSLLLFFSILSPVQLLSGAPAQDELRAVAAYDHYIRLKILKVTPVQDFRGRRLLLLTVRRHYGKVETESLKFHQEHETQEFTILFPAKPDAKLQVGDIVDYKAEGYLHFAH